ncbi:MAG TPA: DNA polymerase III subunit gamma/tau [Thermoanaerobaculia bacterium]|nr:DNA polymerase III subunit gamma/tau [Thermoanaerobaculia bacterium]
MAYQALARKWRPQNFRDMLGQQTTVRTLQNAIEQKRIHHAYLFSGVRGIGKTTAARILAKALNCEKGPASEPCNECTICREITEGIDLDVREIDAATYSKAEDVREIREVLQFQPARDRYRIFIIDEVHSLSGQAWNALLKQIEEPPPHVIFMMATTEMQKVPATILSRVQQLALRKITQEELKGRLAEIARDEGIDADEAAIELIARRGEGSVRDALSLLDQIIAFAGRTLTAPDVTAILGLSGNPFFARVTEAIERGDPAAVLDLLDEASSEGRDFKLLYRDFLGYLRNLLLIAGGAPERMLSMTPPELDSLRETAARFDYTELLRMTSLLLRDDEVVGRSEQQRLAVEIALLKAATLPRLRSVEEALASGSTPPPPSRPAPPRPPAARASSSPAPAAPAAAQASPPPRAAAPAGDEKARLVAAVAQKRRMVAGCLEKAETIRLDGSTLLIELSSESTHETEYLADPAQAEFLAAAAAETFGENVAVQVRVAEPAAAGPPAKKPPAAQDDPLVRAFQKHLGGEVVSRGPAARTRRDDEH